MTAKSVLESATGETAPGTLSQAATLDSDIKAALAKLDPANDTHWTSDGKPAMAALNVLLPAEITRARLEGVAPDFARPPSEPAPAGERSFAEASEQAARIRAEEDYPARIAALEGTVGAQAEDLAFLRNQFGWPTKST